MKRLATHVITRIVASQPHRYDIYVNDTLLLSVHEKVLVKFGLHKGMKVDPTMLRLWQEEEETQKVRQVLWRYLSYRPRTTAELKRYAERKGLAEKEVQKVIQELQTQGLVDDQKYAHDWVVERAQGKKLGKMRLKNELKRKGVAETWIEEAIAQMNDDEERQRAMDIAERRYLRLQHEAWPKVKGKLERFLIYRGFTWDVVDDVLRALQEKYRKEGL